MWFVSVLIYANVENYLLNFVNKDRLARGLQPVCDQPNLDVAANTHSNEMAAYQQMVHESAAFGSPWDRMKRSGFAGFSRSENILKTPKAFNGGNDASFAQHLYLLWKTSPEHWKNIIDPSVNKMGFSFKRNGVFTFATQNFGVGGQPCSSPVKFNPVKRIFNRVAHPISSGLRKAFSWLTGTKTREQKERDDFKRLPDDRDSSTRLKKEQLKKMLLEKEKQKQKENSKHEEHLKKIHKEKSKIIDDASERQDSNNDNSNLPKIESLTPFFADQGEVDLNIFENSTTTDQLNSTKSILDPLLNKIESEALTLGKSSPTATKSSEAASESDIASYIDGISEEADKLGLADDLSPSIEEGIGENSRPDEFVSDSVPTVNISRKKGNSSTDSKLQSSDAISTDAISN
eukprot:NODE_135_length_16508_cov_1.365897.p4 type:complete len:404 gc:universal NODE_135_length_16508_cov_1.365897:10781-9570(-)